MHTRLLILSTLLFASYAQAQSVSVFPLEATNVHAAHAHAAEKLLVIYLKEAGFSPVVMAAEKADGWNKDTAMAEAKRLNTDIFIMGSLIRIGRMAKVALTRYHTTTGTMEHTHSMSAGAPEDMDPILKRLARSMYAGKKAAKPTIDEVTHKEEQAYKRRQATSNFGVKVGGIAGFVGPLQDDPVVAGFGVYWLYDIRNLLLEVETNLGFGDSIENLWNLSLGVYYPFSRTDMSLYLGGGIGFTAFNFNEQQTETTKSLSGSDVWDYSYEETQTPKGMELFGGAGFLLGRQSSVHGKFDIRYFAHTFKANGTLAHGLRFTVGIGF